MNIGVTISDARSFPETLAKSLPDHTFIRIKPGELQQKITQCDMLYLWHLSYDELVTCLQTAEKLPASIHVARQGKDEDLVKLATSKGVHISYAANAFTQSISEFVITSLLMLSKNLHLAATTHQWQKYPQKKIQDLSVLVLGQGSIGKRVVALGERIGMRMYPVGKPEMLAYKKTGMTLINKDLYPTITSIVCCLPLNETTENVLDLTFFSSFRDVDFINITRGRIVNAQELEESIALGYVSAAVLDAFQVEPLPKNDSLWSNPKIVVSAHQSYFSDDWQQLLHDTFVQQVRSAESMRQLP